MFGYLDHAATTPVRPEALEAMLPFLRGEFGNPSGAHRMARAARRAIDDARDQVAAAVGAQPGEVVFTSGGTESDNHAVFGVLRSHGGVGVCSAIEHHAVLDPMVEHGARLVRVLPSGVVDLDHLAACLDESVSLVSVMLANNESGVVQPIGDVVRLVRKRAPHALVHTDAVNAFLWVDVAAATRDADLVTISAHKFGGPKGVGALILRGGVRVGSLLHGGGQENDRRSGTHNVAGIVAMGVAAEITGATRAETVHRVGALRDRLAQGLMAGVADVYESGVDESGDRSHKVAGNCHVCFDGIESESLLFLLERDGLFASAASSCASGAQEPSHVLAAMGVTRDRAKGSLRLTLGYPSTDADVDLALGAIPAAVARLRQFA